MAKYHNKKETKRIGAQLKKLRENSKFDIEDISFMTGFSRNTITAIENGANTDISHIIEIAKAIGVLPQLVFDIPFDLKPRFKLSAERANKMRLTAKIDYIISETDFFELPKFVEEVVSFLNSEFKIQALSTNTSVILKRKVSEKKLKFAKVGRKNHYIKK